MGPEFSVTFRMLLDLWFGVPYLINKRKKKKELPNCADDSLFTESFALYSVVTGAFLEILGRILSKVLCYVYIMCILLGLSSTVFIKHSTEAVYLETFANPSSRSFLLKIHAAIPNDNVPKAMNMLYVLHYALSSLP